MNALCPGSLDLSWFCVWRKCEAAIQKDVYLFIFFTPLCFSGQVLHDSGVFEYTWKELSIWLEHLDNTKEDKKEAVIQFLERVTAVQISWINNAENSTNGN